MTDWHQNFGKPPRDKTASVNVIWANNRPALHAYTVSQLVWDLRGWDFDIGFYRRAENAA
jgi:hypothetical protein